MTLPAIILTLDAGSALSAGSVNAFYSGISFSTMLTTVKTARANSADNDMTTMREER